MKLNPLILAILVFYQHPVLAEIVTDGTVGPAQSISTIEGQLTIGQKLGSLKGGNLFHSFQQFDIETNETAIFTGDDAIRNVISRVTGGTPSHIDGILRSEVGSADFYFINPAGVVFEENSQVDVPASFHISTAGELIFADGSSFSALNPEASTLTVATPEAFGFTPEHNGSLEIIGGQLRFKPGTNVSLSANGLDIQQNARITVERTADFRLDKQPGLDLNLAAIDSATTQAIPVADLKNIQATGGELSIENSWIDVSGNGAGRLTIRAGPMTVTGSADDLFLSGLFANNFGVQDANEADVISIHVNALDLKDALISSSAIDEGSAGKITLTVSGPMQVNNGKIKSGTTGPRNAGIIDVTAGQLTVDGPDSQISSDTTGEGKAGNVRIITKEMMKIQNGGGISSITNGPGDAGIVRVETGQLTVDGPRSQISSDTFSEGNAGDVRVTTKELMKIQNEGKISSNTAGPGDAGFVVVDVGQLTVDGPRSQISSDTFSEGNAGDVNVITREMMKIQNGGRISSNTAGAGNVDSVVVAGPEQLIVDGPRSQISSNTIGEESAGKITLTVSGPMHVNKGKINSGTTGPRNAGIIDVTAGQLTVDGPDSQISSDTTGEGKAGNVRIITKEMMKIQNGGRISSNTNGPGDAGIVRVDTGQLTVDGPRSQISSDTFGEGNAGDVRVKTKELMKIQNEGKISSNTAGPGDAGFVVVDVGQLTVDGPRSQISSDTFSEGNAGDVSVITKELMDILNKGRISSKTEGPGHAGNILIINSSIWNRLQNNGQIIATVLSKEGGYAGDIKITAPVLILNNGRILNVGGEGGDIEITGQILGAFDLVEKPNSINVVSATSGVVSVEPAPNLAADLVSVVAPNLNIDTINQDPCAHRDENSLRKIGQGGAPAFQHGENYLPINRFDESEHEPEDMDTLQIMPSINTDHKNSATECDKSRRTLN